MHTPTNFDQTDRTRIAPALRYNDAGPDECLSDSSSCTDNRSDLESDDYNDYKSNYESDNEETTCAPTSITKTLSIQLLNVQEQKINATYTLRQEKFNNDFTPKDLLNTIREIFLLLPRDILYNAYDRDEVRDKLVIKINQDDQAPKFSVADDISEVYGLPRIHECINGQKPLRVVIDIDASQKDMETTGVKTQEVFIRICCSFIRALYRIFNCNWEDILKGLVTATSSDYSKCSYHILYALVLLVDHHELKSFTELVYTITGENLHSNYLRDWNIKENDSQNFIYFNRKASLECPLCKHIHDKDHDEPGKVFECDPSIAEKIQQENKNPPQSSHKVKAPGFSKAFVKIPSWVKYSETLTTTETYNERYVRPLPNEDDIYVGSPWEIGKTYILENLAIPNDVNLLVLFTCYSYSNAVTTRLNLKSYCDIDGNINLPDHKRVVCQIESLHRITNNCKCNKKCKCLLIHYDLWLDEIVSIIAQAQSRLAGQSIEKLYKLIQDARRIIVMDNDLTDLNIEWIKAFRKDRVFSIIHNTYQLQEGKTFRLAPNKETVLAELWDWVKQMSLLPFENQKNASLICHLKKDVQEIVCALKTDFPELQIKEYHGKSDPVEKAHDFSNVEEAWKAVDLVAYTSTLKIGVSYTNPNFERAFCLFNSYIETNARTNQMLFCMRYIKDYICHIE
ncbi:hypothetical protein RclHR1_00440002 [Rhizophagus clarus]|uniref:Replication origin-binding protein domain-containing protein n=1 Tax=Rhizophagus clarus TaxID=94130 RepID=A0A2Z6RGW5_9GLOM|nr:hypothetical protein RclHR1_00440002 [Rhizophagus clarus]GET00271.1 hypothetical protein GLOIN_2v1472194 [Rhizophagus clarus]